MTIEPAIVVASITAGLIGFGGGWWIRGHHKPRRRRRTASPVRPEEVTGDLDAARMTPAEAMAHAGPVDVPDETARLDTTTPIVPDDTIALPATTEPAAVEVWRPPEPRVVMTLAWKRTDGPLIAERYDVTEHMPDDIAPLYHAMRNQCRHYGGTITVAVKLDGHGRDDWEWTANTEWPRESVNAIRQARDQLQAVAL